MSSRKPWYCGPSLCNKSLFLLKRKDQKVFSLSGEGRDERNILDINFKLELDGECEENYVYMFYCSTVQL
jgi:hypothetical protein